MKNKIKNYFNDWTLFEKAWLGVFTLVILALSIYWQDTIMGITCSLTGIWCVVLVSKGRISNYWVGIINVVLYAIIAYGQKYYGEVMLNAFYFLPMQCIGIYVWVKNKDKKLVDRVKVKVMSNTNRIITLGLSAFFVVCYAGVLKAMGGNAPFIDSMSTVLSVIAMLLMVYRYAEQWVLWIVVDFASITLWIIALVNGTGSVAVLIMWIAYTINACYGLYNWLKMYKEQEA